MNSEETPMSFAQSLISRPFDRDIYVFLDLVSKANDAAIAFEYWMRFQELTLPSVIAGLSNGAKVCSEVIRAVKVGQRDQITLSQVGLWKLWLRLRAIPNLTERAKTARRTVQGVLAGKSPSREAITASQDFFNAISGTLLRQPQL